MKKPIFLFLALLLPIFVFLFLKFFGKNEFAVTPLFVSELPVAKEGCPNITSLPYVIPDSVLSQIGRTDSLSVIFFGDLKNESANQFSRVKDKAGSEDVTVKSMPLTPQAVSWKNCVFFMKGPSDVVMVDAKGRVRGEYTASDREEMDRLLTEITIILRKY